MSGWWTLKLKPASCAVGMVRMVRAATLLYLLKGSSSGAVVRNHHQVGGSVQVTPALGAPSLEMRLGAGQKPCRHAELNGLLLKEKQQSQTPHLRSCIHTMNMPWVPCNCRRNNSVLPSGVATDIFFSAKYLSVSVHTTTLSFPLGTTDMRTSTSFHCLSKALEGERGAQRCTEASHPQPALPSLCIMCHLPCSGCNSRVAPPLPLVSGTRPENVVSGGQ